MPAEKNADNVAFGEAVARRRESLGLKQSELVERARQAGLTNFHPTTISRIESGEQAIRLHEAVVLARVLGTTLDALTVTVATPVQKLQVIYDEMQNEGWSLRAASERLAATHTRFLDSVLAAPEAVYEQLKKSVDHGESRVPFLVEADQPQLINFYLYGVMTDDDYPEFRNG